MSHFLKSKAFMKAKARGDPKARPLGVRWTALDERPAVYQRQFMCFSGSRTQWLLKERNLNVSLSEVSLCVCKCSLLTWVGPVGLFGRSAVPVTDWPVIMLRFDPFCQCWNRKIMIHRFRLCAEMVMWTMWICICLSDPVPKPSAHNFMSYFPKQPSPFGWLI